MNILHVIPALDPVYGGPIVALLGLVKAQAKLGDQIHVVAGTDLGSAQVQQDMESGGVQVSMASSRRPTVARCMQICRTIDHALASAQIVHIHGLWQFVQTAAALQAKIQGIPYIIRPCGMLDTWSLSQRRILKQLNLALITGRLLSGASVLHATTEREKTEILKTALEHRVSVVPNGVEDSAFTASANELPEELQRLKDSHRLLLFLARVHPKKGLDVLLPAIAKVQTKSTILLIVGPREPSYFEAIRRDIKRLGIEERVRFLEPMYGEARFAAYSAAELYILPSKQENFGITVAESMALGVPVIVSPEVALSDVVSGSNSGVVVPRDPELIAQAIDELLDNDQLRLDMGRSGQLAAKQQFQWSAIAERWQGIYASVIGTSTPSP